MCPALTARGPALALLALVGSACDPGVAQPVVYSHRLHAGQLELACDLCHEGSTAGESAGLPPLATCATCHENANGSSREEAKVVLAVSTGQALGWARILELPRHVYFTHRRHVAVARLPCERCHGPMREQARPPPRPLVALGMGDCMACHRERGAAVDCAACHR